jgi:hypothetical protein
VRGLGWVMDGVCGMSEDKMPERLSEACQALAEAWPRSMIADGSAQALAVWWVQSREDAVGRGLPGIPRHALDRSVGEGLFDARRARRLERGLETVETRLAAEAAGLERAPNRSASSEGIRISRLLIVSADGSERFYRAVGKLTERFATRLEVLLLECDEESLGTAAYGPGRRARALMIDHKDAVVRFLSNLTLE